MSDADTGAKTVRKIYIKTRGKDREPSSSGRDEEKWATMPISLSDETSELSGPGVTELEISLPNEPEPVLVELSDSDQVIGRGEECDIALLLENVSRRHACIYRYRKEYVIEDLNSTNGTFVNDERVDHCVLRNRDSIRIGDATMVFSQSGKG